MLVGNKSDLRHLRAVPTEEAKSFAGLHLFELCLWRSDRSQNYPLSSYLPRARILQ